MNAAAPPTAIVLDPEVFTAAAEQLQRESDALDAYEQARRTTFTPS